MLQNAPRRTVKLSRSIHIANLSIALKSYTNMSPVQKYAKGRTNLFFVDPKKISIKFNPREDFGDIEAMADSIGFKGEGMKEPRGVLQPLRCHIEDGELVLDDGERRLRGLKRAIEKHKLKGKKALAPIILQPQGHTEKDTILQTLICNGGKPLNMMEQATSINRLLNEHKLSAEEIAIHTGVSVTHVRSCLKLTESAPELQDAVRKGTIAASLAIDIIRETPTIEGQREIFQQAEEAAKKANSERITAKHVPIATGKAAQEQRREAQDAKAAQTPAPTEEETPTETTEEPPSPEADDEGTPSTTTEETSTESDPEPDKPRHRSGTSAGVPFQDVQANKAETNAEGTYISQITEEPIAFTNRGTKASVLYVESEGRFFFGYMIAWPGEKKGDGYLRVPPSRGGQSAEHLHEARLQAMQIIRGELETKNLKHKATVLQDIEDAIRAVPLPENAQVHTPESPTTPPPAEGLANPVIREEPKAKTPKEELADLIGSIQRKDAEPERYETLKATVKFLSGKISATQLCRYIMGMESKV